MKQSERVFIFFIGFLIGLLIVSAILTRRASKKEARIEDPWSVHSASAEEANAEKLPESVEASILLGKVLSFGYLPNATDPKERVWILNFRDSYPYVRVVETLQGGSVTYMAADQIVVRLKADEDVTKISPVLEKLGLRVRNFNRKHSVVVLSVLNTDLDAVPKTIEALESWSDLYDSVAPDYLKFK